MYNSLDRTSVVLIYRHLTQNRSRFKRGKVTSKQLNMIPLLSLEAHIHFDGGIEVYCFTNFKTSTRGTSLISPEMYFSPRDSKHGINLLQTGIWSYIIVLYDLPCLRFDIFWQSVDFKAESWMLENHYAKRSRVKWNKILTIFCLFKNVQERNFCKNFLNKWG